MTISRHLDLPPIPPDAPATLGGFLRECAERFGAAEALAFSDPHNGGERVSWSYARLHDEAAAVARAVQAEGVGKGERVGLLMANRPEFVAAFFGVAMAGAVAVTLSTLSTAEELRVLLRQSDISLLLAQRAVAGRSLADDVAAVLPGIAAGRADSADAPFLRKVVLLHGEGDRRFAGWEAFLKAGAGVWQALAEARATRIQPCDQAVIIYTSGTTSLPKGVIHLHSTVVSQFRWQAHIFGRRPGIRVGSPFPLFWSAGLVSVLGSTLAGGGTYVGEEVFEAGAALRLIARERLNEWYGFPTHTAALAEHPGWAEADFSSMTRVQGYFEFDGHPGTRPDRDWNYIVGYGMSESCTFLTSNLSTTPIAVARQNAGRPLPGVELRIVAPDGEGPLPLGEVGEICARGPIVMPHYVGMRREDCFDADGFLHTGDLGFVDADGFLHWTGRIKDMIKTAGANVAPSEIEEAAGALGSLRFSRAIGLADKRLGEMVVLCAVRQDGSDTCEAEVRASLRSRLAAYKVPRRVLFFEIDDYPLTASGKVRDTELRELAAARLAG